MMFNQEFSMNQKAIKYVNHVLDRGSSIEWVLLVPWSFYNCPQSLPYFHFITRRVEIEYLLLELYVHDYVDENDYREKLLLLYAFIYSLDTIEV